MGHIVHSLGRTFCSPVLVYHPELTSGNGADLSQESAVSCLNCLRGHCHFQWPSKRGKMPLTS